MVARVRLKVGVKLCFAFVLFHRVGLWVFAFLFCMYTWMTTNCTICLHDSVHICADVNLGSTKSTKYELYCHMIFVWSHCFWNIIRSIVNLGLTVLLSIWWLWWFDFTTLAFTSSSLLFSFQFSRNRHTPCSTLRFGTRNFWSVLVWHVWSAFWMFQYFDFTELVFTSTSLFCFRHYVEHTE